MEWVIESAPGFVAIKHKMGCPICDASASHCMAAKRSYKIRLDEKEVTDAVTEAWPELVRYRDNYYHLLEDHNTLKETAHSAKTKAEERRIKISDLYEKLSTRQATIKNLDDQVRSLEAELQTTKGKSDNLPNSEELDCYVGRARYALWGKDADWVTHNGYCISDIPASDGEDNDEDQAGLPTMPEEIPQDRPSQPPTRLACTVDKSHRNDIKVIPEAGIPAIGSSRFHTTHKRIIADPPASTTGPALRGTANWVMESDVHDSEMCQLYVEGRALQPHLQSSDCQGTPPDFRPEPFRPELSLASSTLWKRFRAGFTLNTFVDSYGRRVGGLVGDNGRLVEDICAYSHSA
ncbi:hypothetical protein M422DRAFT_251934 [Sphaerobolus stellatus SS14]|uniref:Uncharacterized protein n=1 Tax=Sphaerobolus stellatus (strain SS14) TaxID=990650 RepID=A0A0C9VCD3_SPHS4|nr:hypothetical protein M422DRAFT_251934 [Sphaerobolus stellatus SS14]